MTTRFSLIKTLLLLKKRCAFKGTAGYLFESILQFTAEFWHILLLPLWVIFANFPLVTSLLASFTAVLESNIIFFAIIQWGVVGALLYDRLYYVFNSEIFKKYFPNLATYLSSTRFFYTNWMSNLVTSVRNFFRSFK